MLLQVYLRLCLEFEHLLLLGSPLLLQALLVASVLLFLLCQLPSQLFLLLILILKDLACRGIVSFSPHLHLFFHLKLALAFLKLALSLLKLAGGFSGSIVMIIFFCVHGSGSIVPWWCCLSIVVHPDCGCAARFHHILALLDPVRGISLVFIKVWLLVWLL